MELNKHQFGDSGQGRFRRWISSEEFNSIFTPERDEKQDYTAEEHKIAHDYLIHQHAIIEGIDNQAQQYYDSRSTEDDKEHNVLMGLAMLHPYGAKREHVLGLFEAAKDNWAKRTMNADRAAENAAGVNGQSGLGEDWGHWWLGFDK